jgi:uncharacterized membrane protein YkvA (DUF1232 family)
MRGWGLPVESKGFLQRLKRWAAALKRDVIAVWIAARDPRVPWHAKALALAVAAYALSPIDLIPDFIPVIGYLDDLVILPLGIMAVVRLIPPSLMADFRNRAAARDVRPRSLAGAAVIVALWLTALWLIARRLWPDLLK